MKLNPILMLCSLLIGGLIFYAYRSFGAELLISLFGSCSASIWLIGLMSLEIRENPRSNILMKTVVGILFAVTLPLNILFAYLGTPAPVIVISNSLALIIWFIAFYSALSNEKIKKS